MSGEKIYNALFLCTGNSARSIMAEVMLNSMGNGRFKAWSAGSHPAGKVNPFALELLAKNHLPVEDLRSKNWEEFAGSGAPQIDFVFTVCDNAAGEICPIWPDRPMTAHWGIPDPAAAEGSDDEKRKAFFLAYNRLRTRLSLFINLPLDRLDKMTLQQQLKDIGAARK